MIERIDRSALSDLVVYVDESGDHGLDRVDINYPVFVLAFVVMSRSDYLHKITPALQQLKFDYWGHDQVVFHEREIRKKVGPFSILAHAETRHEFLNSLNAFMEVAPFELCVSVINKHRLRELDINPPNPYTIALNVCMARLIDILRERNQQGRLVHVVFESRGRSEDALLELEFRRIADGRPSWSGETVDFRYARFEPVFARKDANAAGLQLADLVARPCGLQAIKPAQSNRAFDILKWKLSFGPLGWKVFPEQTKGLGRTRTPFADRDTPDPKSHIDEGTAKVEHEGKESPN